MKKLEMTDELKSIIQSIKNGEVYAHIESVSSSGMSRRILFFRISEGWDKKPYIERITAEIGWLAGYLEQGKQKQRGKYVTEAGLYVSGCGMDMIFHLLGNCIPECDKWDGSYNII